MNLFDNLKNVGHNLGLISETQEPVKPVASPKPVVQPSFQPPTPITSTAPVKVAYAPAIPAVSSESEMIYQKLVAKTDFSSTSPAQLLNKFLTPLDGILLDASMKFKTALAQAKAQGGLTEEAIMGAFDTISAALSSAEESFKTKELAFEQKEITTRENQLSGTSARIAALKSEIESAESEVKRLAGEISQCNEKSVRTKINFQQALYRRSNEIMAERAKYTDLIGSK